MRDWGAPRVVLPSLLCSLHLKFSDGWYASAKGVMPYRVNGKARPWVHGISAPRCIERTGNL